MNKMFAIATVLASFAAATSAQAQSADAGAGAKIIAPLEISNVTDLYFGTIAPSTTVADSVVVLADGSRKCGPALTCLTADHTAAAFAVTGEADAFYTINLPKEIKIVNDNGTAMRVSDFNGSKSNGQLLSGAEAFLALWATLPGWRWLARMSRWPGMLWLLERAYNGFLTVRPALQSLARRLEPANGTTTTKTDPTAGSGWSEHLVRELRSDHAGETGAVEIYRGIAAVARRRGDAELLAFAERHGATESEHLRLIEAWLPPAQRSRLLGPWRLAGWLTGALPEVWLFALGALFIAVTLFLPNGVVGLVKKFKAKASNHGDAR